MHMNEKTTKLESRQDAAESHRFSILLSKYFSAAALGYCLILIGVGVLVFGASPRDASAEFGDVIINNYSDRAGMRPVIFPHWFHRVRFRCKICHADLGFQFKAGGNEINMLKIFDGEFCGACHNGQIAWGVENCILCHTGKPGLRTRVHNSTTDRLVVPSDSIRAK